ncbi:hypothetical protein Clacol_003910 [Clathrus columnatus]|uniref:Uncharacterized protein n=1 Tax=Clathrus columnatus TaxID=1419009 RepID=A0AAV5A9I8_9AGAM|nr:hypothetical protein Clacol_003910 [Clathrus columnatus]
MSTTILNIPSSVNGTTRSAGAQPVSPAPVNKHRTNSTATASSLGTVTDIAHDDRDPTLDGLSVVHRPRRDKASVILGIQHRKSMEPIPASARTSIATSRSVPNIPASHAPHTASTPLASLYVVSGLAKSPHTWQLADLESVMGVRHSESAVGRFWRPEVLGSTVTPGAGGTRKKSRKTRNDVATLGMGALPKQDVAKMLSKTLKLSFPREVEIVASTLQPASTVHTFTFNVPNSASSSIPGGVFRSSIFSATTNNGTMTDLGPRPYDDPIVPRPSSIFLGPPPSLQDALQSKAAASPGLGGAAADQITYYGVCLTVWSHADEDRTAAIRRSLENAARARKESNAAPSVTSVRKHRRPGGPNAAAIPAVPSTNGGELGSPNQILRKRSNKGPWQNDVPPESDIDVDTEADVDSVYDGVSESDFDAGASQGLGGSSLFLPGDTVFWLPYALTLVSRHPIYDLMRDYLTLSWARFSKDVQSHSLQIAKILSHPAPRAGDIVRLDATSAKDKEKEGENASLEVICRFPGGLDFGKGLVDVNDPGPWIIGISTEARHVVKPSPEVCICDMICQRPPPGIISQKTQRERYRKILLTAFDAYFHPDYAIPSEFKEAFPAGRFRPLCKIQAKRGSTAAVVAESIKAPEWWSSTKVIQAFDTVLQDKFKKPSIFRRISSFGAVKRMPQLSAAEQLAQVTIRRRAMAFVDARDDLETKIGRLSRRLNFLMSESDLWREKFITFEHYAEKLSSEAAELRSKINKEQKESKRLSSLVTLTASEKVKLEDQLRETEGAHRTALLELEQMRQHMVKMEEERAAMMAEVEAQIERALQSMMVSESEPEDQDRVLSFTSPRPSRPSSRRSSVNSASGPRPSRRLGADGPLPEDVEAEEEATQYKPHKSKDDEKERPSKEKEKENEEEIEPKKLKRFSATRDLPGDSIYAVDENISERSDRISRKVLEIQQKLENALSVDPESEPKSSESDMDATLIGSAPSRPRPNRPARLTQPPIKVQQRTEQRTDLPSPETPKTKFTPPVPVPVHTEGDRVKTHTPSNSRSNQATHAPPPPPLTPAGTEDSDTDFQSAYSQSPPGDSDANSMVGVDIEMEDDAVNDISRRLSPVPLAKNPGLADIAAIPPPWTTRTRASSTATTATATQRSPVLAEHDSIPPTPPPPAIKSQPKAKATANHIQIHNHRDARVNET